MSKNKDLTRNSPYDLNYVSKVERYSGLVERTRKPSKDPYTTISQIPKPGLSINKRKKSK
jgi:hypothetical protein